MTLHFANAFGCEVTAFSSDPAKQEEARSPGAHYFVISTDLDQISKMACRLDMIICTPHAKLEWNAFLMTLRTNNN